MCHHNFNICRRPIIFDMLLLFLLSLRSLLSFLLLIFGGVVIFLLSLVACYFLCYCSKDSIEVVLLDVMALQAVVLRVLSRTSRACPRPPHAKIGTYIWKGFLSSKPSLLPVSFFKKAPSRAKTRSCAHYLDSGCKCQHGSWLF